VRPYSWSIY